MAMTREEMQRLASLGRGGDTMLAHINPEEAALLKARGGSGTINPNTGLPEYFGIKSITGAAKDIGSSVVGAAKDVANLPSSIANTVQQVAAPVSRFKPVSVSKALGRVTAPVVKPVEKAVGQVTSNLANLPGSVENTVKQVAANPVAQIALAYYMPGLVEAFAPSLGALGITGTAAQTAVANAIASTAVQVAQGVPLDQALQTAVTNAAVSSGSTEIAKQINTVISNPAVTNAIVSAGSSAAKTALNGGSQSDIEKNLVAGLVGSGTATATGSNIAGSAAAGGVTGGVTGALTNAASAYGAQKLAEEKAAKGKTTASNFVSGINLAAADTGTASDAGGISVDVSGTPIFADSPRAANVKAPFGFAVMPIEMADNKPSGSYYDYTQNAWIAPVTDIEKFTTMSPLASASASAGRTSVGPGVDLTQPTTTSPTYDPTIISSGGATAGKTVVAKGAGVGTGAGTGAGKGTGTGGVGKSTTTPTPSPILRTTRLSPEELPFIDSKAPTETESEGTPSERELPPVEDKTGTPGVYEPRLFIYGGKSPSTLGSSLKTQAPFYPLAGTSGGLTSTRGAGELESKETGKPRQNVWNEESLRLKDALGV